MIIESTPELVKKVYEQSMSRLGVVRERLRRPLTLSEKILFGHLASPGDAELEPGHSYVYLRPDRVALQDATAQMAILQFMLADRNNAALPVTIHCDHLVRAETGAETDTARAREENGEVYDFLSSSAARYGFGFWQPGSGIIHQVVLEQYAFPGLLMLGTDSHTPNAGGLGALACGVGGADAVDAMVGSPWEVLMPATVGVRLTGAQRGWTTPKDVILKLLGILTVKGGTNRIIEYFGPGTHNLSCTGKGTICNMGAELGATTSVFPFDERMVTFLKATGRESLATLAEQYRDLLVADPETEAAPGTYYDQVVEIDLGTLEPHVVGPHRPDRAVPVSGMREHLRTGEWPAELTNALIGSCTNASYEDLARVAAMADEAVARGVKPVVPLYITPGSAQIRATIERDGILDRLKAIGAVVLANACGPCIGQWTRHDMPPGRRNSIVSSYNRNFPRRNDGNAETCSFLTSPETTLAYALHGRLDLDPYDTPLKAADGSVFRLTPPGPAPEVPAGGYKRDDRGYQAPPPAGGGAVKIAPDSKRLQALVPFDAWDGGDLEGLVVLVKARGACTTDHISPAGKWLRFRGHLENISDNAFSGAVNAFTGESGLATNALTGEEHLPVSRIAGQYKADGQGWVAVGDENYGEGSSREHAAMSPRFLGCRAVIARSFARIHESNLKKQGVLPMTFADPSDYDKVQAADRVDITDLANLAPGRNVIARLRHGDGGIDEVVLKHSLNPEQIVWFRDGSAMNTLRRQQGS